jgi:cytochrome P450
MLDSKLPVQGRDNSKSVMRNRSVISAGTCTTSATLASATFHLLSNPGILRKLKMEIEAAIPDVKSIRRSTRWRTCHAWYVHRTIVYSGRDAESDYLWNAIIQETLHLHSPASMRHEKVAPKDDIPVMTSDGKKYTTPRGVSDL